MLATAFYMRDPVSVSSDWWMDALLQRAAVVAAWIAVVAWLMNRRLLAVPMHLVSVFAPWGYLYPMQLLAIVLAFVAAATFQSAKRGRAT